jgi:hypothetical protein
MLENKIEELTNVINELVNVLNTMQTLSAPTTAPAVEPKAKRGRKKKEEPAAPAPTLEVVETAPTDSPDEPEPVVESTPEPVIEELPPLSKEEVGERLRSVAQSIDDTAKLQEVIKSFGADRFSDVQPKDYQALLNKAEALVATDA